MKKFNADGFPLFAPDGRRYRLGRVHFFARLEEIRIGISLGYSLRTLHKQYADVLLLSYSQFTRYVIRYITRPTPEAREACARALQRHREKAREADSSSPAAAGQPQFKHHRDTPKEDLI